MACVAVTRGGAGSLWRFASLDAASDHPIVQYGDAMCSSGEDVRRTFRPQELSGLADRLGQPQLARDIRAWSGSIGRSDLEHYAQRIWELMLKSAPPPPEDPSDIVRLVRQDRVAARSTPQVYRLHPSERTSLQPREETDMTDETTKRTPPVREPKIAGNSVISFGTDKDGNKYGADNNPKKAGSRSAERFANYRDGETVTELLERGGTTRADVNYDSEKGFIVLS